MSKDLFEIRIRESLSQAEATPPKGAWGAIQSKIRQSGSATFSFPVAAVIVTASLLMGGMVLSDISRPDEISENSIEPTNSLINENVADESSSKNVTSYETLLETEETSNQVDVSKDSEIQAGNDETVNEVIEETLNKVTLENQPQTEASRTLPIQVQAPRVLQTEIDQENKTLSSINTSDEKSDKEKLTSKSVQIRGVKECYTPCRLNLSASGDQASQYTWDAGKFGNAEEAQLELLIDEPAEFTVFLTAYFDTENQVETSQHVVVKEGSKLFVPNSFTPNGDGYNDDFVVKGSGIESFSMSIINSKGEVVFQSSSLEEAWNFDSGLEIENEVYTAIVRAVGIDGKVHTANQRLTILP